MEEEDCSKLSPALDLNQAMSNENDEAVKGELEKGQAQKSWQQENDEVRVSSLGDTDEAPPVEDAITVPKVLLGPEDEAVRVPENQPVSDDVAGNGADSILPLPARDGSRSRSLSPSEAAPANNTSRASYGSRSRSPSPSKAAPAKCSESLPPAPLPVRRSKRSHASGERSRSPSPKKRRSSAVGHRSFSRSPEGRHGRQTLSRSSEGRHGKRKEDGRRRHDRSRSPVGRAQRHERSRSWSPYERERERESRSRYSPWRRSPPPMYSSKGDRSQRKRPWSPPRNRNTGIGKPGNHLFVAGFSFATTERDLEKKFGRYGRVTDVRIIRDRRSGDSRGFGFLSLEWDEEADDAIKGLDQTEWNGRIVLVEKAKTN